jgi:hypothetical protein
VATPYSSEEGDMDICERLWMQDPASAITKFLNLYQEGACVSVYLEIMLKKSINNSVECITLIIVMAPHSVCMA